MSSSPLPSGRGAGGVGSSRRRFTSVGIAVFVVAFAAASVGVRYAWNRFTEPRDDLGRFQGEWRLTVADRAKQFPIAVRVTGDRWVYLVGDTDQKRYTLTLRPDANPKEIDLVQIGPDGTPLLEKRDGKFTPVTLRGIYTIEGGSAKVVTAPSPLPRPTSFDDPDAPPVWLLEKL